MEQGNEVWRVVIFSHEFVNEQAQYYVFATSAARAELAGLELAKKQKIPEPYCTSAELHCYVH